MELVTTTQSLELLIEKYEPRLKAILNSIKKELESFSWFCSAIFREGIGGFAFAVSREQARVNLMRRGDFDEQDFEVQANTWSYTTDKAEEVGMTFKLSAYSFSGDSILNQGIDQDITFSAFLSSNKAMSEEDVELEMQILEKFEPYQMVLAVQRWLKGRSVAR